MGLFFYNIFLRVFTAGVFITSFFNPKVKKWRNGRKGLLEQIKNSINSSDKVIWVHCASLGEFEQGRPVIEEIKKTYPEYKILLTFFSPSGYEIRKKYSQADWVFYLPMDGRQNAEQFIEAVNPQLVIFVKYEFWYYYLSGLKQRNIPLLFISVIFRESQPFFKWYGGLHKKMLCSITHFFVQDATSKDLLDKLNLGLSSTLSGDTRFDRVSVIAQSTESLPQFEALASTTQLIVAGSTWPEDEKLLRHLLPAKYSLVLVPHEITPTHLAPLKELFPEAILYSSFTTETLQQIQTNQQPIVLIIDSIGLLSRLYRYAYITYIGGGFGKGIHNTLEAAVYGKPVLFGPNFQKFREAKELIAQGAAFSITTQEDLKNTITQLTTNYGLYTRTCEAAYTYVANNTGATKSIIHYIQEKRLLIN